MGGHKISDKPRAFYSQHLGLWLKWSCVAVNEIVSASAPEEQFSWYSNPHAGGCVNHKEYNTDTDEEEADPDSGWIVLVLT